MEHQLPGTVAVGGVPGTTEVRPGESLVAAASRHAGVPGESLLARDLSSDLAVFIPWPHDDRVALRPAGRGDLAWLVKWRNSPRVAPWWADDPDDLSGLTRHHGPTLDGRTSTRLWIAEHRGRSFGFLQDYPIGDHPEFALLSGHPDALGVDYLIGEDAWAGRGYGTKMLWAWLQVVAAQRPEVAECFAAPDHRNTDSLRLLERVGFRAGLWFDEPQRDGTATTVVGCSLDVAAVLGRRDGGDAGRA